MRERYGFKKNEYLVGSFQKTEGSDLSSPKLIKGPDIFLNIVREIFEENSNLKVVLSGKGRQYLINNFEKLGIPYKHFEMVDIKTLNELYNLLDIYCFIKNRGRSTTIIECGLTKTQLFLQTLVLLVKFLVQLQYIKIAISRMQTRYKCCISK